MMSAYESKAAAERAVRELRKRNPRNPLGKLKPVHVDNVRSVTLIESYHVSMGRVWLFR